MMMKIEEEIKQESFYSLKQKSAINIIYTYSNKKLGIQQ